MGRDYQDLADVDWDKGMVDPPDPDPHCEQCGAYIDRMDGKCEECLERKKEEDEDAN